VAGSFTCSSGVSYVASFMGQARPSGTGPPPYLIAVKAYRAASPITHVSASSAPMLLFHGDADVAVPFHQSELMEAAMKKAGVEVKLSSPAWRRPRIRGGNG
jgi:dipeptidyl aminopeptidase/acylaminoacyl peptidase